MCKIGILGTLGIAIATMTILGCVTRPMTNRENSFAKALFKSDLEFDSIRIAKGTEEPYKKMKTFEEQIKTSMDSKNIIGKGIPNINKIGAITIGNIIAFSHENYRNDFWDSFETENIYDYIALFSHELFHIWQYQNEGKTGYSIFKVVKEHLLYDNPYLYNLDEEIGGTKKSLLEYRYEQQAQIFQDFILYYLLVVHNHIGNEDIVNIYRRYAEKLLDAGINPEDIAQKSIEYYEQKVRSIFR